MVERYLIGARLTSLRHFKPPSPVGRQVRKIICWRATAFSAVSVQYPELEAEDIREALACAAANLDDKVIEL
jgi:hypothetical protein